MTPPHSHSMIRWW